MRRERHPAALPGVAPQAATADTAAPARESRRGRAFSASHSLQQGVTLRTRPMSLLALHRAASVLLASTALAQISPGNLIVVRAGDGAFALTNSAHHVFLDEYDATALTQPAPLQSLAMPITIAGTSNHGFVTQSVDGRYLVVTGFLASPYTGLIAFTTSVAFPRVIARVALGGAVDATTALTETHSGGGGLPGDFVSAATVDGSAFWTSGTGVQTGNRGICYTTLGATTSVQLASVPNASRVANITDGQLHASTVYLPQIGVNAVGTGLPTTPGQTTALLSGMPGTSGTAQPWDFWFADASTLYVADAGMTGSGGIQKWTRSGGTWTLQYTLAPGANVGCRSVSGSRDQAGTRLYATTTQVSGNQLVTVLDTGAGSAFATLATAPTNTGFRGVRFVRQPYGVSFAGTGCPTASGVPTIGIAGGLPIAGNTNFGIAIDSTPASSLYLTIVAIGGTLTAGVPLSLVGGPPCAILYTPALDLLLVGATDASGNGVTPLSLGPAVSAMWGLGLPVQHAVFDPVTYGAFGLPLATSQGMQLLLGN